MVSQDWQLRDSMPRVAVPAPCCDAVFQKAALYSYWNEFFWFADFSVILILNLMLNLILNLT